MVMIMKNDLIQYADENQLELYKKFPSTHYLSNQDNVLHVLAWSTFFKRNLHRFVIDYLKIPLFEYQTMFNRGSIGEFDDVEYTKTPKNTLEAIESAKGGTVDRSWIDTTAIKPITKNRQVETDVSFSDLRKNGFKSVATLATYAKEALQNAFFYDVFSMIDSAIVGGDQLITAGGSAPTQDAVDKMTLYLIDRNPDAVAVCLSKYAQKLYRMSGYENYLSEKQKDDFNRYGLVKFLDGVRIASISGARKTGKGQLLLPDKRIYGVAGIVGDLDMKGELHTYEDFDNSNEKVIIRVKDFTYSVGITNIENCCKMVLTD